MKVYNKVIIDIYSRETIYEDSYEYLGEVSLAKGGGGGGGSGEVDYPPYMKQIQADWLGGGEPDGTGLVTLTAGNDITSLLDAAIGSSPFATTSAYDPANELSDMDTDISNFETTDPNLQFLGAEARASDAVQTLDNFDNDTPFSGVDSQLTAYESYIDSVSTTVGVESELSKFDAGMTNINAVNSSSFGVGHQIIAGGLIEAKLQAESDLTAKHTQTASEKVKKGSVTVNGAMKLAQIASSNDGQRSQIELDQATKRLHYNVEVARLKIAASVEEANKNIKLDKNDALWDIEVFTTAGNVLASIGGGTVSKPAAGDEVSDGQAALSGALSGAAMGSAISPGIGTAIGAVVGGIGGALMN